MNFHEANLRKISSQREETVGKILTYCDKSLNAVTKRNSPEGFFMRKLGETNCTVTPTSSGFAKTQSCSSLSASS